MNVNGLGGAASLPMTLPSSSGNQPATAAPSGVPGAAGSSGTSGAGGAGDAGQPTGDLRLPGRQRAPRNEAASKPEKEMPKPAPLPPLRGLTVAEIRAMLGVAPMPGQVDAAAGHTSGIGTSGIGSSGIGSSGIGGSGIGGSGIGSSGIGSSGLGGSGSRSTTAFDRYA